MGSGCNSSNNNVFQSGSTSDKNVTYTGPSIAALGICTNDKLSEVEGIILQKIIDFSTGVGICIPNIDLTACELFTNYVTGCCSSSCNELDDLMSIIFDSLCTLYTDYTTLKTELDNFLNTTYAASCLGLTNPTLTQLLQELLTEFCVLKSTVAALQTQVNTLSSGLSTTIGNQILSSIQSCNSQVSKSGTGASATVTFKGFVPIGGIIPYGGPTAGLFSGGLGLANTEMCGWAIANGDNGTWDMREEVPVGAGAGVMGGSTLPSNTNGANYGMGALVGQAFHTLVIAEIPSGSFSGSGTHTHDIIGVSVNTSTNGAGSNASFCLDVCTAIPGFPLANTNCAGTANGVPVVFSGKISTATVSISGTTAGGGEPHENRQPSRALIFIQRIS